MPEPSIHDILFDSFPASGKEDWLRRASLELPDKNPVENLIWQNDGLKFYPYYVKADLKEIENAKNFNTPSYGKAGWLNTPEIAVIHEQSANEKALEYLMGGADGILFDVSDLRDFDIDGLLKKINWNFCIISFVTTDTKIATKIFEYAAEKNYDPSKLNGCIFWKSLPGNKELDNATGIRFPKCHTLGIIVPPASAVKEISTCIQQSVLLMDAMTDMGIDRAIIFRSISLSLTCDENFFITIAKLKALRALWYQLSQAFEVLGYSPTDLHIHCRSRNEVEEKYQPHGSMIKNTVQALSAILGGCNALTLPSEGVNNVMIQRIALNVSNILKEESHLDKVANPLAGSYAIENLVHELSKAAWKDFQNHL
jgi:methylmalonyl-CoA mutase